MPDENDEVATSVTVICRRNAKTGLNAIKSQSGILRNPNTGSRVEVGFLDTGIVCGTDRD